MQAKMTVEDKMPSHPPLPHLSLHWGAAASEGRDRQKGNPRTLPSQLLVPLEKAFSVPATATRVFQEKDIRFATAVTHRMQCPINWTTLIQRTPLSLHDQRTMASTSRSKTPSLNRSAGTAACRPTPHGNGSQEPNLSPGETRIAAASHIPSRTSKPQMRRLWISMGTMIRTDRSIGRSGRRSLQRFCMD